MSCKGKCYKYKTNRGANDSYYTEDNPDKKFCSVCECKMLWPDTNCPCCGHRMRTKPRNYKLHTKILAGRIQHTPRKEDLREQQQLITITIEPMPVHMPLIKS